MFSGKDSTRPLSRIFKTLMNNLRVFTLFFCLASMISLVVCFTVDGLTIMSVLRFHIPSQAAHKLIHSGLPPGLVIFTINVLVCLPCLAGLKIASYANLDKLRHKDPRSAQRLENSNGTTILNIMPFVRRTRRMNLKMAVFWTRGVSTIGVATLASLIAFALIVHGLNSGNMARSFALLVPHGLFEIAGLMIVYTLSGAFYHLAENQLVNGQSDEAFKILDQHVRSTLFRLGLTLAAILLLLAAMIEAHVTKPLVDRLFN